MNDLQRLNLMMARGAKLDDIITAITSKGGIVESPQKVAEIVSAIGAVATWDADLIAANILTGKSIFGVDGNLQAKQYASGSTTLINQSTITISGLTFTPNYVFVSARNTTYHRASNTIIRPNKIVHGDPSGSIIIDALCATSQINQREWEYYEAGSINGNSFTAKTMMITDQYMSIWWEAAIL